MITISLKLIRTPIVLLFNDHCCSDSPSVSSLFYLLSMAWSHFYFLVIINKCFLYVIAILRHEPSFKSHLSKNTVDSASSGGKPGSEVTANGRRPGGISTMLQLEMIKNGPACDPVCVMEWGMPSLSWGGQNSHTDAESYSLIPRKNARAWKLGIWEICRLGLLKIIKRSQFTILI